MEKMSREHAMLDLIVMELCELKHHLCNGRQFEAGVGLGGLINSLLNRKDILEEEDEEVQDEDEDEECEESSEEENSFEEDYIAERVKNKELEKRLKESFELLKGLYNNDHIFPDQREETRQFLLRTDEFIDGNYGRIIPKS